MLVAFKHSQWLFGHSTAVKIASIWGSKKELWRRRRQPMNKEEEAKGGDEEGEADIGVGVETRRKKGTK